MTQTTCDRCEHAYDTDRVPSVAHANPARCPKCGSENTAELATVGDTPPGVADVVEQIDTDGKELHLHVHYHD